MKLDGLKGVKLGFNTPDGRVVHLPPELTRLQRIERYRELVELYPSKWWDRKAGE